MTVLITGGISEFSTKLAEILISDGNKVLLLMHGNPNDQIPTALLNNPSLTLLNLSSVNEDGIRGLIAKNDVETVFDASLTTPDVELGPIQGAKTLILGITSVLDAIRTSSPVPSLVLVSGEEVYGNSTIRVETQPLEPVSFVGAAQMSVEAMVHSYAVSYRIPIVIGRVEKTLSIPDAALGIIKIAQLAKTFENPAEVFNISSQNNEKVLKSGVWAPNSAENVGEIDGSTTKLQPLLLVYGEDGTAKKKFLELVKSEGLEVKESSIKDFQAASDKSVWDEVNSLSPSHLIYFSNENEQFEGDCFTLRTNMATNLYFPWLLASVAERTATHFTHFGNQHLIGTDSQESSAEAVKGFAEKMLVYFENTLRLGQNVDSNVLEMIKARKTSRINNNNV
uniref:NAD(P)-bd_dom domain-containing protein n=1 Tax=Caenorhabditis japonica TaxID=281687 RepID=A0A8R1DMC6_CAEJA